MQKCQMNYRHRCAGEAKTQVKDFLDGPRWMCEPCAEEWGREQDQAVRAFRHNTRGVDYGHLSDRKRRD